MPDEDEEEGEQPSDLYDDVSAATATRSTPKKMGIAVMPMPKRPPSDDEDEPQEQECLYEVM